jgi:hypothetical protein
MLTKKMCSQRESIIYLLKGSAMALLSLLPAVLLLLVPKQSAAEKITIGAIEDVILLPWDVKIAARIDTGAATSSIDVCDYAVEGKFVSFTLADRCGAYKVRAPLIEMRHVKSTEGDETRPVVEIEICLGAKRLRAFVTLSNRSHLEYPFLVGRNIIEGNFVVDVSLSKTFLPICPGVKLP